MENKTPHLVKWQREDSQYDGKPLLKGHQPYTFKYEYRLGQMKDDGKITFLQKSDIVRQDFIEYSKDLIYMRENAFIFKTAAFVKRNWGRLVYGFSVINEKFWHGLYHMTAGLKQLYREGAWAVSTSKATYRSKYSSVSYK